MSGEQSGMTAGLRALLGRLQTFRVDWHVPVGVKALRDELDYEPGIDIEESNLDLANVVSSLHKPALLGLTGTTPEHVLAIDLDVPAYLVPSSTPGHSHLYVDVKIPHHRYMALLSALADAGIIEPGYAAVSIKRGRSDLRLPWVQKGDPLPVKPEPIIAPPAAPVPAPAVDVVFPAF